MSLALNDSFPFGKYKHQRLADVLKADPGYFCWLRENSKAEGKPDKFKIEVHAEIDKAIAGSRALSNKYTPWNKKAVDLDKVLKGRSQQAAARDERVASEEEQRELHYAGEWGAW